MQPGERWRNAPAEGTSFARCFKLTPVKALKMLPRIVATGINLVLRKGSRIIRFFLS
jgi:hypothetical protein